MYNFNDAMKKQILIDSLVLLLVLGAFTLFEKIHQAPQIASTAQSDVLPTPIPNPGLATTTINIGGVNLTAEIASTPDEQEQGLSGRASLASTSAMLFVFQTPAEVPFWMQEMNFSLDIIWLDAEKRVVTIWPDLSPSTYPETFAPSSPAMYVLEVNAGFAASHSLKVGDSAKFAE
jgi:uncharacterized membrane protein (UPF0127 family)